MEGDGYGRACCEGWLVRCGCDGFNFVICFDGRGEQRGATVEQSLNLSHGFARGGIC